MIHINLIKKTTALLLALLISLSFSGCIGTVEAVPGQPYYSAPGVTIEDKGTHFNVVLDYTSGLSGRQIGENYGKGILQMVPDFEYLVDTYISEGLPSYEYNYGLGRTYDIIPQIPQQYREELEGLSLAFSGENDNKWKDGKLSRDETLMFNLFTDVIRLTQCSYISVYGDRSASGSTITSRNLDWYRGELNQLPRLQSVITIKYPDKQICMIGYLGHMGALTAINDSKVFAGILDSNTGEAYTSEGRRSYVMDLRMALENYDSMDDAVEFMRDPAKLYSVNHIIGFSDPESSVILENNFSGNSAIPGERVQRAVRTDNSALNQGIEWDISGAVASVNAFLLKGNNDKHTNNNYKTKRWKNIHTELLSKGDTVSFKDLKDITSYFSGSSPGVFSESGDIYNMMTVHMMVIQPETLTLEIFFPPRDSLWNPTDPVFEKINIFL